MMLLAQDWRQEVIERLRNHKSILENLEDAKAQLEVVKERDPRVSARGSGDIRKSGNSGKDQSDPSIRLMMQEEKLKEQIYEYESIIREFNAGWRVLSQAEKDILTRRFMEGMSIPKVCEATGFSDTYVKKLTRSGIRKMECHLIKY